MLLRPSRGAGTLAVMRLLAIVCDNKFQCKLDCGIPISKSRQQLFAYQDSNSSASGHMALAIRRTSDFNKFPRHEE